MRRALLPRWRAGCRRWVVAAAAAATLLVGLGVGCSPEASRTQGDGPGADVGNHSPQPPLHGDGIMFDKTPRVGEAITK